MTRPWGTGLHNVFVQWIQDTHPELGITTDQEWFSWCPYPRYIKGSLLTGYGHRIFLNSKWETRVSWFVGPGPVWALVRQRGKVTPLVAAKQQGYEPFHVIPVEEFCF